MTYRTFVAGAPSAATAYALHLLERTVDEAEQRMAAYYARAGTADASAAEGLGSVPVVREDIDPVSARVLGITPGEALSQERLANILGGRSADGGELDGHQRGVRRYEAEEGGAERHRIAGVDLCFSAPKSVSVAWAFAETDAERNSILQAHRDARDEALAYVEREIGVARDGERGRLAWITVDHFTARPTVEVTRPDPATGVVATELYTLPRAGDPQLHSHCVVPNLLVTASGRVLSINRDLMRDRVHEFGAVYQAMLARRLRAIGVEVELDGRTLAARLPCIPENVCEEFSRRTRDAQAAAREHAARGGRDWDAMPEEARVAFLKGGAKASREGKGDDLADADAWRAQAAATGWSHRSAVRAGRPAPPPPEADRIAAARAVAAELLGRELEKRAVLTAGDVRAAAARALISTGAASADDVLAVTRALARDGVVQDGRRTALIWRGGGPEDGRARVTTALHRDQEEELVRLARAAGADARGALRPGELEAAARRTGVALSAEQEIAARALGEGGRLAVAVGAAGVGKTTLLRPLVDAWAAGGREVWGAALAWRQAGALEEAGIPRDRLRALQPLLDGLADGSVAPGRDAVVVVDELGQVGTRQLLELLRFQARRGFKVVAVGDERQCQSVEAGPVIGLLREALGPKAVPEVLTTVRQRGEREREIAGLFRGAGTESAEAHAANVARALAMKRGDGTAELVPGGYREAVERAADLVLARRDAGGPGYTVTVSAPTNADALAIGRAIRARRQARGEVGPDRVAVRATDGAGNAYALQLAVGDRVRLFARTRGVFAGPGGRGKSAAIGDNGSVLEVAEVRPSRGLVLRTAAGKEGFVAWDKLRDEGSGRVRLAYGDCLTIDSSQGLTSDEHVNALPGGSRAVTGFKAYVAESRHRVASWLVGSAGAELRDAAERRPMNAPPPGDPAAEAWENVARNLARQPVRETALGLLRATVAEAKEGARAFQGALRAIETREAAGRPATTLRRTLERVQANRAMPRLAAAMGEAARGLAAVAARVEVLARRGLRAAAPSPAAAPRPAPRRVRISEAEAQAQLLEAMRSAGLRPSGAPVMDGQRHYVPVEGNHGRRMSGAYMAFYDEGVPNALLWNYKTGTKAKWVAAGDAVPLGPEDAARLAAAAEARRAGQAAERARREEAGAAAAGWLLEGCRPADPAHPYLARKAVAPHGLVQDLNGRLVVPLRDAEGRLWNLQTIGPRGEKLLLPGARKVGTFFTIGPDADPRRPLWLAEGFATAATVHAATGLPAVVALDASNLAPVAAALRAREPSRPLLFAADNDHGLPRRPDPLPNVGLERARAAAAAVGGRVAAPDFAPADRGTDWNDFAARHGLAAAREALRAALRRSETDGPGEAPGLSEAPSVPARVRERAAARQGPRMGA
jgi:conjugative relaxase-like TrwC/TraI family protein